MKKYLFGFLAIALALGFSAFTTKKAHKPFTYNSVIYYHGACEQNVTTNNPDLFNCKNSGMTSSYGFVSTNWNSTASSATIGTGDYIGKIEYNSSDYASISALVTDLEYYFETSPGTHSFPTNGGEFNPHGNGQVKISRATSTY